MKVRAKVKCTQANKSDGGGISVNFAAVTPKEFDAQGNSDSENASFARWTPSLNLSMYISPGTSAVDAFEAGKEYYLDFTAATNDSNPDQPPPKDPPHHP